MSIQLQTMQQLTKRAEDALIKELGIVDTLRYLSQFRSGIGNYTDERQQLFAGMSVKEIVREIKERR